MANNINVYDEFLIYRTADDQVKIEVKIEDETVWLTQLK